MPEDDTPAVEAVQTGDEDPIFSKQVYTIQQKVNGRYLDAYENNKNGNDYQVVTRNKQNNDSQEWEIKYVYPSGGCGNAGDGHACQLVYLKQMSTGRCLSAL